MRKPQICYEKGEEGEHRHPQSSGTLARVKRFLSLSLGGGGRRSPSVERSCAKVAIPPSSSPQVLTNLKTEAEHVLGRSLDELIRKQPTEQAYGVPSFVHELCCYMLTHGVDYATLVTVDWMADDFKSLLLEGVSKDMSFGCEPSSNSTMAASLLRLFLLELPHPLLNKETTIAILKIRKEIDDVEAVRCEHIRKIRNLLARKLSPNNLNLLQYLTNFLHQLQVANHNTCPVPQPELGRVLARVLTDEGKRDSMGNSSSEMLAEMLLLNHATIFREGSRIQNTDYSSDSVSSACDSRGEETGCEEGGLFSPEGENESVLSGELSVVTDEVEEDSTTTTTTDTDDFQSPPVSPINQPFLVREPSTSPPVYGISSSVTRIRYVSKLPKLKPNSLPIDPATPVTPDPGARAATSSAVVQATSWDLNRKLLSDRETCHRKRKGHAADQGVEGHYHKAFRSTSEISDGDYRPKITPCGKKYLPSITGFVTSPGESWTDEKLRRDVDSFGSLSSIQSAESSCISGGDVSDENEGDRDADGSETEGTTIQNDPPCPHDERRFSEQFYPRTHSNSGRKLKRKTRRKHSKDAKTRVPSSEEEERGQQMSGFASLLSRDEEPITFDPSPAELTKPNAFQELVESSDPVQSDRSSWCLRRDEEALSDNWQRTAKLYCREDDDKSIEPSNWYRADDAEEDYPSSGLKYSDYGSSGLSDDFAHPRGGGSQAAIKVLSKHVSSLKRKIKKFEEEFEISFGYRPSHSDKVKYPHIKKQLSEISKLKKELKQMKDEMPEKKKSKSYPMSLLRCQESTSQVSSSSSSMQTSSDGAEASETLRQVEGRLSNKRDNARRPTELTLLSLEQYQDEKVDLQKALLYYESIHGRPVTREDRDRVRPLYDRYRQVKRGISKLSSKSKENIELAPIIEHVVMDFTLASPQHRGMSQSDEGAPETPEDTNQSSQPEEVEEEIPSSEVIETSAMPFVPEINLGDLHALPTYELKERKREAKEQKKKIRKNLREFEEKFETENGRKMLKEERGPMEHAYTQYKHVKAKLRLLEALLSKHDSR